MCNIFKQAQLRALIGLILKIILYTKYFYFLLKFSRKTLIPSKDLFLQFRLLETIHLERLEYEGGRVQISLKFANEHK